MPARVIRETYKLGILRQGMHVLEVGSGALRNAKWLQHRGLSVDVVEYPSVVAKYARDYQRHVTNGGFVHNTMPRQYFDAVVCTFVLGTITPGQARMTLLSSVREVLKPGGVFILAVRGPGDVKTKTRAGRRWRDGYLTPGGTFIKAFRRVELVMLCAQAGLRPANHKIASNSGIVDLILEACDD